MSLLASLVNGRIPAEPDAAVVRRVRLCSVENHDDDADLTPVRRTRKREIHKNHPMVVKCRELKGEGLSMDQISIVSGTEPTFVEKWNKKGWLEIQTRKRRTKEAD